MTRSAYLVVASVLVCATVPAAAAFAQDSETQPAGQQDAPAAERNWSNSTELSWVLSRGNSESTSFSVRNVYTYDWTRAQFYWEASILRATSVDDDFAVGTPDDFEVVTPDVDVDHNRLTNKLRYYRRLGDKFFWYANFDGSRDAPANINAQFIGSMGIGNDWHDTDSLTFRTAYGPSYTYEDLDFEGESTFAGYRLFYNLQAAGDSTKVTSELTFDGSFENARDVRFDWLNSLGVSMTEALSFQGSLRILYRNIPALDDVDLFDPTTGADLGTVVVSKEKFDATVSMSLVIDF